MPPNSSAYASSCTGVLNEDDVETVDGGLDRDVKALVQASSCKHQYLWPNIAVFAIGHLIGAYGLYQAFVSAHGLTALWSLLLYNVSMLGITAGVHRLWSHRSYQAAFPLRLLLVMFSTIAHQNSVFHWAREHRVHHKFSETDADPVNATRGFFYSHVGWLVVKKHPDVQKKGSTVDVSDLLADPLLTFQRRYYVWCVLVLSVGMPLLVPVYGWGESWTNALCVAVVLRWVCSLHAVWLVNSAAHMYGDHPYDANINPSENATVSLLAWGEGFHNFHHMFPWDYKTSEYGNPLNPTKAFLDWCARRGWVWDLKTVSAEMVERRMKRTGDGTVNLWGWVDAEQDPVEREMINGAAGKNK